MGNHVTAHNTINSVRSDIVTETKNLKNSFQELFANMKCKVTSQSNISGTIDEIVNYLKNTEKNLSEAQQAATALAGVNRKVAEKSISISAFAAISGVASIHPIDINTVGATQALAGFRGCAQRLEAKIEILNRCKKEISALSESEQNISSVSVLDSFFAGLIGGMKSAVTKVKTVKQQCVEGLKSAVSNLKKAISCISDIGNENGRFAKLISEFEACDASIINRYKISKYSDVITRTNQYNEGNLPAENDLTNEIENTKSIKGSIETVVNEECKELNEAVTRLEDLYKNNYGFEARIKALQNQDGFRDGESSPYNRYSPNYKGHVVPGASCYAIAAIFQYECTGQWAETNYVDINNVNDIKAGDMLHYYGYNATGIDENGNQTGHWVFVYKIEEVNGVKKIYYAEGNAYDSDTNRTGVNNYGVLDESSSGTMGRIRFSDVRRPNL